MGLHAEVFDVESFDNHVSQHEGQETTSTDVKSLPRVSLQSSLYVRYCKPAIDRVCAVCALIVLAVPMLVVAGLVGHSMGRPVLFRQRRVGLNGKIFEVLKFRSMNACRRQSSHTVPVEHRVNHKCETDPRHTTVGRFLRRFSLDELPQLINVARGEMSLIGPRPELESVVERFYTDDLHQRHLVKPGLTGLWQISARGTGPMHENGEWDIEYVGSVSPLTDLRILLKTPLVIFGDRAGQ